MDNELKKKVFLLEDDPILSDLLKVFLENNKFKVDLKQNGTDAYKTLFNKKYNIILLDISVPGMNGLDILSQIREKHITTPVIMITGNTEDEQEIKSFQNGTNIFHKKPIQTQLLLYQIRSLLKEEKGSVTNVEYKDLRIDDNSKKVTYQGTRFNLSRNEYITLLFLIRNKKRIISKNQIIENLYLDDEEILDSSVDTLMSRLRKRLRKAEVVDIKIVTVRSFGYRLE